MVFTESFYSGSLSVYQLFGRCVQRTTNCRFMVWVVRVKSGNFGHQVNSDMHLLTLEIQMSYEPSQGFSLFA